MFHSTHIHETQTDITLIVILTAHLNRFLNRTVLINFINQATESKDENSDSSGRSGPPLK